MRILREKPVNEPIFAVEAAILVGDNCVSANVGDYRLMVRHRAIGPECFGARDGFGIPPRSVPEYAVECRLS